MLNIAERIKEERERLGLSQSKFGSIAGVSKQTVITWEKGNTSPTAVQLNEMSSFGLDAMYVLLGRRTIAVQSLTVRETCMLENYRALAEEDKAAMQRVSHALAQSAKLNDESA